MKLKKLLCVILSCLIFVMCTACADSHSDKKLKLVASFYPIYIMALNITDGVDGVEVTNMVDQSVGCLHNFTLSTSDMKNIENADAIIINGAGMEGFMSKIIEQTPNIKVIDSSKGIELKMDMYSHDHDDDAQEEDHLHTEINPHIWVSIKNYIKQVENISNAIIELDPFNRDKYLENTRVYVDKLNVLYNEMESDLNNIASRDIITVHNDFMYFADDFGLNIAGIINQEDDAQPSAKEVSEIISLINETGVKALFIEPQYSRTVADTIANETNIKVRVLDPGVSGEVSKDAYINIMRQNQKSLKEALS